MDDLRSVFSEHLAALRVLLAKTPKTERGILQRLRKTTSVFAVSCQDRLVFLENEQVSLDAELVALENQRDIPEGIGQSWLSRIAENQRELEDTYLLTAGLRELLLEVLRADWPAATFPVIDDALDRTHELALRMQAQSREWAALYEKVRWRLLTVSGLSLDR